MASLQRVHTVCWLWISCPEAWAASHWRALRRVRRSSTAAQGPRAGLAWMPSRPCCREATSRKTMVHMYAATCQHPRAGAVLEPWLWSCSRCTLPWHAPEGHALCTSSMCGQLGVAAACTRHFEGLVGTSTALCDLHRQFTILVNMGIAWQCDRQHQTCPLRGFAGS